MVHSSLTSAWRAHHRANLHRSTAVEHRAPGRELDRLRQVPGLDDDEPRDQVLDLDVGAVRHRPLAATDYLAIGCERLARIPDVSLRLQLAHPGQPHPHALLGHLGRAHGLLLLLRSDPEEIDELAHARGLLVQAPPLDW